MPAKPRAISFHCIPPNFTIASARILQASAKASIAILVLRGTFLPAIYFNAIVNAANPPPTPTSPLTISEKGKAPIFSIAPDKILIAAATRIRAKAAFMSPFESNLYNDSVTERRVMLSMVNIAVIAPSDLAISPASSLDKVAIDADKIPTAIAIETMDETLIPVVNDSNESCNESRTSLILLPSFTLSCMPLPNKPSITFFIVPKRPPSFVPRANNPPPRRPAKISPPETFLTSHVNTLETVSPRLLRTSDINPAIVDITSLKLPKAPEMVFRTDEIPEATLLNAPVIPFVPNPSLSDVKKSPITAANSRS